MDRFRLMAKCVYTHEANDALPFRPEICIRMVLSIKPTAYKGQYTSAYVSMRQHCVCVHFDLPVYEALC